MSGESLDPEKRGKVDTVEPSSLDGHEVTVESGGANPLHRNLQGRHMQMIAMYVFSAQCLSFLIVELRSSYTY
jgi:amino acid permease